MAKSATLNHCVFSVVMLLSLLRSVICDDNMGEWSDNRQKLLFIAFFSAPYLLRSLLGLQKIYFPRFDSLIYWVFGSEISLKACHLIESQKDQQQTIISVELQSQISQNNDIWGKFLVWKHRGKVSFSKWKLWEFCAVKQSNIGNTYAGRENNLSLSVGVVE